MISPSPQSPPAVVPARRSFWQRRLVDPVLSLLRQGVTADRVALTLAVGAGVSMFPFLGFTALLNLAVGIRLRMNQPILQTLNQLLAPVHLLMIIVYVRIGEMIWGAEHLSFSVSSLLSTLRRESFADFLDQFGWAGVHAFTAWLVTLPLIIVPLYYGLRPILRRAARVRMSRLRPL